LLCLVVFVIVSGFAAAVSNLAVEGNYWFGGSRQGTFIFGPEEADFSHQSLSLAVSADLAPGFVLVADYAFSNCTDPAVDGQAVSAEGYSLRQHLGSVSVGRLLTIKPGFALTASVGWGFYQRREQISEDGSVGFRLDVSAGRPQAAVAAQLKLTPQVTVSGNFAALLGTKAMFKIGSSSVGSWDEISLSLRRWQLEGKYALHPGWEAVLGYRVWDIAAESSTYGNIPGNLDTTGFYLGARFSL
jgi:hypothetical protein